MSEWSGCIGIPCVFQRSSIKELSYFTRGKSIKTFNMLSVFAALLQLNEVDEHLERATV